MFKINALVKRKINQFWSTFQCELRLFKKSIVLLSILNNNNKINTKRAGQGDPISFYLFILALELLFYLIKTNNKIEGLNICDYSFLQSAYPGDTTCFLKNGSFVMDFVSMIRLFFQLFGIKIKHFQKRNRWYSSTEKGSSGCLWFEIC